ncbi:MAG: hypothetical protein M3R47_14585, partial [Chloroflexota bacterium]|nr:hypothetical protein [Chloroflexota bacterium]
SSSAVFLGKVTNVGFEYKPITSLLNKIYNKLYLPQPYYHTDMFSGRQINFEVKSSWKYVSTIKISLRDRDVCGYGYKPFVLGKEYLIYAYLSDNNLESDLNIDTFSRVLEAPYTIEDFTYLNTLSTLPLKPVHSYTRAYWFGIAMSLIALWSINRLKRQRRNKLTDKLSN